MKRKLQAALVGGGSAFLLVLALSLVPQLALCSCLIELFGGILAAFFYIEKSPVRVSHGEGALVGLLAGILTGSLNLCATIIRYIFYRKRFNAQLMLILERFQRTGLNPQFNTRIFFISLIFGLSLGTLLVFIIEAIGGLIGVALFEKRELSAAHRGRLRRHHLPRRLIGERRTRYHCFFLCRRHELSYNLLA